jgi:hypothetical protein
MGKGVSRKLRTLGSIRGEVGTGIYVKANVARTGFSRSLAFDGDSSSNRRPSNQVRAPARVKPTEGRIYISGSFTTVNRNKCGGIVGWLDNDPHFWRPPPTWGICRTDFRRVIKVGDCIFFVLPKASECIISPISLPLHCWVLRADRAN